MASKSAMIAKGKAKYEAGVNRIGVDTYSKCGDLGGMNTAVCLREAKERSASAAEWARSWETAMGI